MPFSGKLLLSSRPIRIGSMLAVAEVVAVEEAELLLVDWSGRKLRKPTAAAARGMYRFY